jgi:hypothetical protein
VVADASYRVVQLRPFVRESNDRHFAGCAVDDQPIVTRTDLTDDAHGIAAACGRNSKIRTEGALGMDMKTLEILGYRFTFFENGELAAWTAQLRVS